ncbi:MAG: hypothetical protein QM791_12230 [Ferruginibacter sp.]
MKLKSKKLLKNNIDQILADIKKKVLDEYGLTDVQISEISFSTHTGCPPGKSWVCQSFGNDPVTGKPIIKCGCV